MLSDQEFSRLQDETAEAIYRAIKSVAEEAEGLKGIARSQMLVAAATSLRLLQGGETAAISFSH